MPLICVLLSCLTFFSVLSANPAPIRAEEVRVAVASNFLSTIKELAKTFEKDGKHSILLSSGSSGKLYAQITHGAPFDVFFSADVTRPQLLEEHGLAVQGSRVTYAVGRLALWSPDPSRITDQVESVLSSDSFDHLAIANPKTAPYGTAAKDVLMALGLWKKVKNRLVQGENISQTFQFVRSENAQLGFIALSQVLHSKIKGSGSRWVVPTELYRPLTQQAVLLMHGSENSIARKFLAYVQGPKGKKIIQESGYGFDSGNKEPS